VCDWTSDSRIQTVLLLPEMSPARSQPAVAQVGVASTLFRRPWTMVSKNTRVDSGRHASYIRHCSSDTPPGLLGWYAETPGLLYLDWCEETRSRSFCPVHAASGKKASFSQRHHLRGWGSQFEKGFNIGARDKQLGFRIQNLVFGTGIKG